MADEKQGGGVMKDAFFEARRLCIALCLAVVLLMSQSSMAAGLWDQMVWDQDVWAAPLDSDGDTVSDNQDNCTIVSNTNQRDSNGDGYGNACDADLNNDGVVTVVDYLIMRSRMNQMDDDADLNGDGYVTVVDYLMLRSRLNQPPGPSGLVH